MRFHIFFPPYLSLSTLAYVLKILAIRLLCYLTHTYPFTHITLIANLNILELFICHTCNYNLFTKRKKLIKVMFLKGCRYTRGQKKEAGSTLIYCY